MFFENSQLKEKGFYKLGKEDGIVEKFFENGQLKEKMTPGNNIIFLGAGLSSNIANKFKKFFTKKC